MTFRGITVSSSLLFARKRIAAAALVLALVLVGDMAAAEKADDNFGIAVTAYRAGKHAQALETWRSLADEGNPLAQFNVGLLHYKGYGTARSYAQALIWFHAAARQGLAVSYLRLGAMFERGEGVPRDLEQAYLWYTLAVSAFGPGPCRDKALDGRRSLAKNLTEAQVLKVLAESSEWAPGPLGGVGQPCFDTIAVRPIDGMARSVAVAKKEPKKEIKPKTAAAPVKPKPQAKRVAQANSKKAPDIRDTKTAAETTVTPPGKPAVTAQTLMTKLPAKMPSGKASAAPRELAAVDPRNDGEREQPAPLPTVDVAKRKVHTVRPPGSGKVPLVGTSPRPAYTPKKQVTVAGPAVKESPAVRSEPAAAAPAAPAALADAKRQTAKGQMVPLAPAREAAPVQMRAVDKPAASMPVRDVVMPAPETPKPSARTAKPVREIAMPKASPREQVRSAKSHAGTGKVAKKQVRKQAKRTRVARLAHSKTRRAKSSYTRPSTVYVQLGALSTRKMADRVWDRLRTDNRDILNGHQRLIVKFHADSGKVLYRLYAGPFDDGGKADAFCNSLKQRSEACFIPPKFRKRG